MAKGKSTVKINIGASPLEFTFTVVLFLAIIGVWTYDPDYKDAYNYENTAVESSSYDGPFEVVKVVDGDTVKLLIGEEVTTVRLIGIDTPESVHPDKEKNVPEGKLASDHTKELLDDELVYVEYGQESHDRYGRALAYLYLDEQTMVNARILEDGYAKVYTIKPNDKYEDYFLRLEEEARSGNAGLWSTGVFE